MASLILQWEDCECINRGKEDKRSFPGHETLDPTKREYRSKS